MKIAWCHTGVTGGAKRATYDMVRELSRRGHVIDEYIVCDQPILDFLPLTDYVRNTYVVSFGPLIRKQLKPYILDAYVWFGKCAWRRRQMTPRLKQTANEINSRGYDFVHLDQHPGAHTMGLLPYLKIPSVVYSHEVSAVRYKGINHSCNGNAPSGNGARSGLREIYRRFCDLAINEERQMMERYAIRRMPHASLILVNSDHTKDLFFHVYGRLARTSYLGVDHERFKPLNLTREHTVLSVGRLVKPKEHQLIIRAVGQMQKFERPRIVIATPESETQSSIPMEIQRLAKDLDVELFIAWNPGDRELVRLYNTALAVVFVPIMEPFGLVPLEAMACGTPVVGVKEAGIRETVVDGETGFLVERHPEAIAEALRKLSADQVLRNGMGQRAVRNIRERWTWPIAIDRYEHEVNNLLGKEASYDALERK